MLQLVEQFLSLFQIERIEAFGEPAIDRSAACLPSCRLLAEQRVCADPFDILAQRGCKFRKPQANNSPAAKIV